MQEIITILGGILVFQTLITAIYINMKKMKPKNLNRLFLIGNVLSLVIGILRNNFELGISGFTYLISSIYGSFSKKVQ